MFVECDSKGVWLRPERKLLDPTVSPAARTTFLNRVQSTGYVVFLIRPDGFVPFRRYRDVLITYNATAERPLDFGYEPVNADWKLVYPTP